MVKWTIMPGCEADVSRSTPSRSAFLHTAHCTLARVSEGNRTRCLDLHRVACHPATPRTPSDQWAVGSGQNNLLCPLPTAHWLQSGRQGTRTLISVGRTALAERPGQPY